MGGLPASLSPRLLSPLPWPPSLCRLACGRRLPCQWSGLQSGGLEAVAETVPRTWGAAQPRAEAPGPLLSQAAGGASWTLFPRPGKAWRPVGRRPWPGRWRVAYPPGRDLGREATSRVGPRRAPVLAPRCRWGSEVELAARHLVRGGECVRQRPGRGGGGAEPP